MLNSSFLQKTWFGWFLVLFNLFLFPPKIYNFSSNDIEWEIFRIKSENPLFSISSLFDSYSNLAKRDFRITVPILNYFLNLSPVYWIIFQYCIGILFLFLLKFSINRLTKNGVLKNLMFCAFSTLYLVRCFFDDVDHLWFDGFAFLFILIAQQSNSSLVIFFSVILGCFVDERAVFSFLIVFSGYYFAHKKIDTFDFAFFKLARNQWFLLFGLFTYFLIRWFLSINYGLTTPSNGASFSMLKRTIPYFNLGLLSALSGFLFLFIYLLFDFIKNSQFNYIVLILPILVLFLISAMVADLTRSITYSFPFIFILLKFYLNEQNKHWFTRVSVISVISIFLTKPFVCVDWEVSRWMSVNIFQLWLGLN
jgi:hypothetical protein